MMRTIFSLLGETLRQWLAHRGPRMGAALSFYTVFSLGPLAVLTLSLVSLAVERSAARAEMINQIRFQMGDEGARMVEMILTKTAAANAASMPSRKVLIFGRLLFSSTVRLMRKGRRALISLILVRIAALSAALRVALIRLSMVRWVG